MTAPGATGEQAHVERAVEPLWRGLLVYRTLTLISSTIVVVATLDRFAAPAGALAVQAVMAAWTAITGVGYLGRRVPRRTGLALADLAVTCAVMATTPLVQSPAQIAADAPVMGSIWTPGAVLACALVLGVPGALCGSAVLGAVLLAISAHAAREAGDIQLIVLVTVAIGFAATVLRRQARQLARAAVAEAAAAERERLLRAVHDGVLQVLGYVRRRGAELGGPAGELAGLAGEQEVALRTLLTSGSTGADARGRRDLAAALRMLGTARVSVSTPAHAVPLPAGVVDELVAAVGAALANTARHVGPDAPAWVLLEQLPGAIEISVRDAGPGIPPGRLDEAAAQGRLGVARSLRGRVADLGGTIALDTGPDRGTEWTLRLGTRP
jgi:signal transduction histidine kinase